MKIDNDLYVRDYSRCILCYKCVDACGEQWQNTFAISVAGRGFGAEISTEFGVALPESACVYCGNCVAVCPTGALIGEDRVRPPRGRKPGTSPRSREVDTVCPYCGVGCNLTLHVQDGAIVKVTAPPDDETTRGNLCIKGRFGWQFVQPLAGASCAWSGWAHRPGSSPGSSSNVSSKTDSSASAARGRTSSTVTAQPVSRVSDVNAASSSPHAVIQLVNGAVSRSTLSANPCVVTQREMWTPIDAIFRGGDSSHTPVRPEMHVASTSYAATVATIACSSSRQYLLTSRPCRFRSRIG